MKEKSRKNNKENFNKKQAENLLKITPLKSYSTNLFSNHTVKETGPTTMTNLQGASVLLQIFNMSNPKLNIHKDKSNQTKDIITKHHNNIEERNKKPQ